MKKTALIFLALAFFTTAAFADDDDLFFGDGVDYQDDVSAKSDLARGILFEDGSVRVGGSLDAGLETMTVLYDESGNSFSDNLADTTLTPKLSATLFFDARPSQVLRIYTKFGFAYPFESNLAARFVYNNTIPQLSTVQTSFSDYFSLKELFTDFSINDVAFFRFGIHTVKWGTGYFYSPISDLINTSSIDPENVDEDLDGCLNLRTQILFPGTQNVLWLYLVPDTESVSMADFSTALKYTSLAAKYEFVVKSWEFGVGGIYKYEHAPKMMFTTSGNIGDVNVFSEFLYAYGSDKEWAEDSSWNDKTNIIKATVGCTYYWKDPQIALVAQYYYDGNNFSGDTLADALYFKDYITQGHNLAFTISFGKLFGSTDFAANILALANFGREDLSPAFTAAISSLGADISSYIKAFTIAGTFSYSPIDEIIMSMGPYVTFNNGFENPSVALKLSFSLGGGKF